MTLDPDLTLFFQLVNQLVDLLTVDTWASLDSPNAQTCELTGCQ
jgi:hypothetical protein